MVSKAEKKENEEYSRYKQVLSKDEYSNLQKARAEELKEKGRRLIGTGIPLRRYKSQRIAARQARELREERYAQRPSQKFASNVLKYGRVARQVKYSGKGGRRPGAGRPKGSYDPRYRQYGGVYSYRKILNARLRILKEQARRNSMIPPQDQQILNQLQLQREASQLNPERRMIPDTSGRVDMKRFQDEIDSAANSFS